MRDMVAKGRGCSVRGDDNPNSKLSWVDVNKIRAVYDGSFGIQARLAKEYGITKAQMSSIINGRSWVEK